MVALLETLFISLGPSKQQDPQFKSRGPATKTF